MKTPTSQEILDHELTMKIIEAIKGTVDRNQKLYSTQELANAIKLAIELERSKFKSGEMPSDDFDSWLQKNCIFVNNRIEWGDIIYDIEHIGKLYQVWKSLSSPPSKAESDAVRFAEYVIKKGYKLTIALPEIYAQFKLTNK